MSQQDDLAYACAVLRKADTDTKKLAALLIVGKLFADRPLSIADKSKLLHLIECDFLLKLLNNQLSADSTGDDDGDDCDTSFSLDIVVQFIPNIIRDFEHCELFFDVLGKMLLVNFSNADSPMYGQHTDNIVDCFRLVNSSIAQLNTKQVDQLAHCYLDYILKLFLSEQSTTAKLEELILHFSNHLNAENFDAFFGTICRQFYECKSLDKFKLCKLLRLILQNRSVDSISLEKAKWPKQVRDSLFEIFKNKLTVQFRNDALELATQMTLSFAGMDWIKCDQWNTDNSKFLVLLLRLVCIEVQLLLPRLLEEQQSNYQMGSLLILLEQLMFAFINNLDLGEEEGEEAKTDTLLQIDSNTIVSSINAIREAMRKVVEFIKELSENPVPGDDFHQLLVASIRLLCAYITEESEELRHEIAEVLPFILDTINKQNSNVQMEGVKRQVMTAVRLLYEDDTMKAIIVQHGMQLEAIDEE